MDWSWVHSCRFCQKMQLRCSQKLHETLGEKIDLAVTYDDVTAGAQNGCTFYARVKEAMESFPSAIDHSKPGNAYMSLRSGDGMLVYIMPTSTPYFAFTIEGDPIKDIVQRQLPNLNVGIGETAVTARAWISNCLANHPACSSEDIPEGPTRLLKLDESGLSVRLVDNEQNFRYATLSYCWGVPQEEHQLTKKRFASHYTAIPVSKLPKSIQDSIAVVRSLGEVSHMWIDSLCIIQDDKSDRDRELAKMGDIYRGSVVTVSAANAKSCRDGFLVSRKCPNHLRPVARLPFLFDDGRKGTVYLVPQTALDIGPDPINDRAWTFQEHILSPRILYYSSQQLYFACRSKIESDGGMQADRSDQIDVGHDIKLFAFGKRENSETENSEEAVVDWDVVVKAYSKRQLTKPADRYVALEGVGRQMAKAMGTTFVAGFLASRLVEDLWWAVENPQAPPDDPAGPSWSWVSVSGEVGMAGKQSTCSKLEVLSVDVKWELPGSQSGKIDSAVLRVRTWAKPPQLRFKGKEESPCFVINDVEVPLSYHPSTTEDWPEKEQTIDAWLMELYVCDGEYTMMYGLVLEELPSGDFKRKAAFSIDYLRLRLLGAKKHEEGSQGLEVHGSLGFQQLEMQLV